MGLFFFGKQAILSQYDFIVWTILNHQGSCEYDRRCP